MPSVQSLAVRFLSSLLLAGCAAGEDTVPADCHPGVLVDGGGRCQALRKRDGSTVTFYADMNGWRLGQEACVCGPRAEMTPCPRDSAVEAVWLAPFCPPANPTR